MVTEKGEDWEIRIAQKKDWGKISAISREISEEEGFSDYINDTGPRYLETGETFLLENEETLGFQKVNEMPDSSLYLSGLRIRKKYRRHGYATKLIEYVLESGIARGLKSARSLVEPDNFASLALLSKLGFRKLDLMNFYLGTMDLSGYENVTDWPDAPLAIGFVWAKPFQGLPAILKRNGKSMVFVSESNKWSDVTSFTVLSKGDYVFNAGNSVVNIPDSLGIHELGGLTPFDGFERAFLLELEMGRLYYRK